MTSRQVGSRRCSRVVAQPCEEGFEAGEEEEECGLEVVSSFDEMPLDAKLLRGIYGYGWEKPSPIQQRAILPFLGGGDLIAQAQSGTGKTGAFTVGLLQRVDFRQRACQAVVLLPTRELALQTEQVISHVGDHLAGGQPGFCGCFVGGTAVPQDVQKLRSGAVVVAVGTPGRVWDLMKRGAFSTAALKVLVLDEADEMLSVGFAEQIYQIFRFLPPEIQVALFSATMADAVLELSEKFMRNPTRILVKKETLSLKGIKQFYVALEDKDKLDTLMDLYESVSVAQSVIFCNTRQRVEWLAQKMNEKDFTVSFMHSAMPKGERQRVLDTFRSGRSRVLIATDLLARGIDVQHVNIVVNYDMPRQGEEKGPGCSHRESYLHRIGRSGRYGRKGVAINFVRAQDMAVLRDLEGFYQVEVEELPQNFADHLE